MKTGITFVLGLSLAIFVWWFVVIRPTSQATKKDDEQFDTANDTPSQFLDAFGSYEGLKLLWTCWPVLSVFVAFVIGMVMLLFRWLGLPD